MRRLLAAAVLAAGAVAGAAAAEDVPVEEAEITGGTVTVYLHPFLTDEETTVLRLVQTNDEARALFIPEGKGFAAMALAPREGLVRRGAPVPSAQAVAGLADLETARAQAVEACNAVKRRGPDCVVVLEVATK